MDHEDLVEKPGNSRTYKITKQDWLAVAVAIAILIIGYFFAKWAAIS